MKLNNQRPNSKIIIGLAAVLAITGITYAVTHPNKTEKTTESKPALVVNLVQVSKQSLAASVPADGKIMAWQEAVIGAQVNGLQLREVKVNIGDFVKKGQVLAQFKTDSVNAEWAQYNANVLEAQANLAQAKMDAERANRLKASGAMSAQQIAQFNTNYKAAQARLNAAIAAKNVGAVRVAQAAVLAPDDGVISARSATVGSVAQAGQELFRMVLKNRLEWRAELSADAIKNVQNGATATIYLADGETIKGTVRQVAPTLNDKTNSATVFVDILSNGNARAGMFAKGTFDLAANNAMTVPSTAVVMRDGFNYVFKVNEQKRTVQVKVETGRRNADSVEIISGLNDGDAIVASGTDFLKDGDTVKVNP
ncbi:MAG: efflux RND transporter periplasmic adaptor subunit [Formosimonas sp.]